MSKLAFLLCLWIAIGLDMALRASFATGNGASYSPSVTLAFIAAVAAFAPVFPALSVAFVAGLLLDLTQTYSLKPDAAARLGGVSVITIIGPHALGGLLGAYVVTRCRAFFLRRNPLSMVALAMLCAVVTHAAALALLFLRTALDPTLVPVHEFWARMLSALLTGVPGLLLGFSWRWILPFLGLPDPFSRQGSYVRGGV